jgi:hypothetical protein
MEIIDQKFLKVFIKEFFFENQMLIYVRMIIIFINFTKSSYFNSSCHSIALRLDNIRSIPKKKSDFDVTLS